MKVGDSYMNDSLIQNQNIESITTEIKMLKQQTAQNIIEIGKRLIKAKEMLSHGEWLPWLEKEVDFTRQTASRFMQVAEEFGNGTSMYHLSTGHLFALLSLPAPEREDFVEENNVEDMTQRELRAAIKAKKEAEEKAMLLEQQKEIAMDQNKNYVEQVHQLQKEIDDLSKRPPREIIKTVEKEVMPRDYHSLKDKVFQLENNLENREIQLRRLEEDKELLQKKIKLTEKEAGEYDQLKKQINLLRNQKKDFEREIAAITELSGLVIKVETFLKQELAPIKYSRAIEEQKHDDIVQQNLKDIINRVYKWCDDMSSLLNSENHYNAEVIDYAE